MPVFLTRLPFTLILTQWCSDAGEKNATDFSNSNLLDGFKKVFQIKLNTEEPILGVWLQWWLPIRVEKAQPEPERVM